MHTNRLANRFLEIKPTDLIVRGLRLGLVAALCTWESKKAYDNEVYMCVCVSMCSFVHSSLMCCVMTVNFSASVLLSTATR